MAQWMSVLFSKETLYRGHVDCLQRAVYCMLPDETYAQSRLVYSFLSVNALFKCPVFATVVVDA